MKKLFLLFLIFLLSILSAGCITPSQKQSNGRAQVQPQVQKIINETHNVAEKIIIKIPVISPSKNYTVSNYTKTISQGSFTFIPLNISGKLNIFVNTSRPSNIYVVNNTLKQLYYAITQEQPVYFMQPILRVENRGCTEKNNYVGSNLNCNIHKKYNHIGLLIINNGLGNNQVNIIINRYRYKKGKISITGNKNTINHEIRTIWYTKYGKLGTHLYYIYYIQDNYIQYPLYSNLNLELNNLAGYEILNADSIKDVQYKFNMLTNKKIVNQQRAIIFLVNEIKAITPNRNIQAQIASSLISNGINYDYETEKYHMNGYTERYPYQVIYDNLGICQSKAILITYLLKELGFNTGIFLFGDISHMDSALKVPFKQSYRGTGYTVVSSIDDVPIGSDIYSKQLSQYPVTFPIPINKGKTYTGKLYIGHKGGAK